MEFCDKYFTDHTFKGHLFGNTKKENITKWNDLYRKSDRQTKKIFERIYNLVIKLGRKINSVSEHDWGCSMCDERMKVASISWTLNPKGIYDNHGTATEFIINPNKGAWLGSPEFGHMGCGKHTEEEKDQLS